MADVSALTGLGAPTVKRTLRRLMEAGQVLQEGRTRGVRYRRA